MAKTIAIFDGKAPTGATRVVKVRFYDDLEEFACEVTDNGKRRDAADYFTSDKDDALGTAAHMAGHHVKVAE